MKYLATNLLLSVTICVPLLSNASDKSSNPKTAIETVCAAPLVDQMTPEQLRSYYAKAQEMAEYIVATASKHGMDMWLSTESLNPAYSRVTSNGGLALETYYDLPNSFITPLGLFKISKGAGFRGDSKDKTMKEIKEKLGLVEMMARQSSDTDDFGPIYAVTQDLQGHRMPTPELVARRFDLSYEGDKRLWAQVKPAVRKD